MTNTVVLVVTYISRCIGGQDATVYIDVSADKLRLAVETVTF
jgi:hypothetical protein